MRESEPVPTGAKLFCFRCGHSWFPRSLAMFLVREKYTLARLALFAGVSLLLGLFLTTGISFPNGSTFVTTGATTVQTPNYLTYTAELSGPNSFPPLYGLAWLLVVLGVLGLIFLFRDTYLTIFAPKERLDRMT